MSGATKRICTMALVLTAIAIQAETPAGELRQFDGIEFVWVPAREFLMGSTSASSEDDEQPLTRVRISRGFWLGKYEVTQGQWQALMGSNPSHFDECGPDCPVEKVSWNDVQAFIGRLNTRAGEARYRLPTEAEWEHAARAGTTEDTYPVDVTVKGRRLERFMRIVHHCGGRAGPVGRNKPNAWGIYDMLGGVWEWVEDWYGGYPGGAVTDPRGPGSGSHRAVRGNSEPYLKRDCRPSNRSYDSPSYRRSSIGFRLLRTE